MSYRVFVSYSHEDNDIKERLIYHLSDLGFRALHDSGFSPGLSIRHQVESKIAYSHALLPIVTENSLGSAWVQQEIGFALGVGVPIIPVCVETVPEGFIAGDCAIVLQRNLKNLADQLTKNVIVDLVGSGNEPNLRAGRPVFETAFHVDDRSQLLSSFADYVKQIDSANKLRHSGGFSSFSIPPKPLDDEIWLKREGVSHRRSPKQRELLVKERVSLEYHARNVSCDLIIAPVFDSPDVTREMRIARLEILHEFVEGMPENKIRLAVLFQQRDLCENVIIVGDWFYAQSVTPSRDGFLNTILTRHAPTVTQQVSTFDKFFKIKYEKAAGRTPKGDAIEKIDRCLNEVRRLFPL